MKYAILQTQRCEATPGSSAACPICGAPMLAKCGERRVWHWAHRSTRVCDRWWERDTEWHRTWKERFPVAWQEFIQTAQDGERHVADVHTAHKWTIEFQHSYLPPDERRSREAFYGQMVWVVDGLRRKRDRSQFFNALECGARVPIPALMLAVHPSECALLRDWAESRAQVFFDFGEARDPNVGSRVLEPVLWRLDPRSGPDRAHLTPVRRAQFIEAFQTGKPCKVIAGGPITTPPSITLAIRPFDPRPSGFQQYLARRARSRRRF